MAHASEDSPCYVRLDRVGEGMYGTVYNCALREIAVLKELSHPNIVRLMDAQHTHDELHLVFEYVETDLHRLMRKQPLLDVDIVKSLMYQLLRGIAHCHACRILHRDLKPHNLLVTSTWQLKIADFGISRAFGLPLRPYTHEVITQWYRAPEVLLGAHRYSTAVDVWSAGCIFAELALGKPVFRGDSEIGQLVLIFRALGTPTETDWPGLSTLPHYKDQFPCWPPASAAKLAPRLCPDGQDLLARMLMLNPDARITAHDALRHPYFTAAYR